MSAFRLLDRQKKKGGGGGLRVKMQLYSTNLLETDLSFKFVCVLKKERERGAFANWT